MKICYFKELILVSLANTMVKVNLMGHRKAWLLTSTLLPIPGTLWDSLNLVSGKTINHLFGSFYPLIFPLLLKFKRILTTIIKHCAEQQLPCSPGFIPFSLVPDIPNPCDVPWESQVTTYSDAFQSLLIFCMLPF